MSAANVHPVFNQVDESSNLSQLIRSNGPEFWSYMKHGADLEPLKRFLRFEGTIAGDPHLGNFAPLPLTTKHGRRLMKFVNVDFDDAGQGPFALDYVRYVTTVKALSPESSRRVLQEAYLLGLRQKAVAPPASVQKWLAMKVSQYDDMAWKYARARSCNQGFKFKEGKIEHYNYDIEARTIKELFPAEEILGLANRPEDRGGRMGVIRIWVLVQGKNSRRRIMELKQYVEPGTARFQPQPAVKQWLSRVRQAFWPELTGSEYDLITLDGHRRFWIRPKQVTLVDVPYSSQKKSRREFVIDLARYDAYILGLAHGRQRQSHGYAETIGKNFDTFHDATKAVSKAYLDLAQRVLDSRTHA